MRKRKVWVEPLFGEGKAWHTMRRFRLRTLRKVNIKGLVIAAGQNLKRFLSWRGWGRRSGPTGAIGVVIARQTGTDSWMLAGRIMKQAQAATPSRHKNHCGIQLPQKGFSTGRSILRYWCE